MSALSANYAAELPNPTTFLLKSFQRRLHLLGNNSSPFASAAAASTATIPNQQQHIPAVVLPNLAAEPESSAQAVDYAVYLPTFNPPIIENLVASSAEDLSNHHDAVLDSYSDIEYLFGSPMAFDSTEQGLWNGRFVPPPPRPPFFTDEPMVSDEPASCDLCAWAMPTKSNFIFESSIEKASELGWPLTLIIVSVLSALVGAIIMITVIRCKRKKASNNRNETHVQWWSRHKRPHTSGGIDAHLRRNNIYTAHPADNIRGLQQNSLSATSSITAITSMVAVDVSATGSAGMDDSNQERLRPLQHCLMQLQPAQQLHQLATQRQPYKLEFEFEHESASHQTAKLHRQQHQQQSSSMALLSSAPSIMLNSAIMPTGSQLQHAPEQHIANEPRECHWQHSPVLAS